MTDAPIGHDIDRYTGLQPLARGGMADVYRARAVDGGAQVAIKLLQPSRSGRNLNQRRFTREVRTLTRLHHPNIVPIIDYDLDANRPYFVMPYMPGGSLRQRLAWLRSNNDWLTLAEALRIVLELSDALAHAHAHGLVHRDIKPANILFDADGRTVLSDFGIVKRLDGAIDQTQAGVLIGTPAYLSPEQALGQAGDARSDIYALGVLFFLLVTGRPPFDAGEPLAVVLKHIDEPTPFPSRFNPQLPAALEKIILRALAKNPADRYQSAAAFGAELRAALRAGRWGWVAALPADVLRGPWPEVSRPDPLAETELPLPAPHAHRLWPIAALVCVVLVALLVLLW